MKGANVMKLVSKRIISYNEYAEMLARLIRQFKNDEKIKNIKTVYGIPRGGLPIAIHLSHIMGWNFATNPFDDHYENTLIVDDIADTGITLKKCGSLYINATLFYKPWSEVKPDFYVEESNEWIVFPWEDIDEIPNR